MRKGSLVLVLITVLPATMHARNAIVRAYVDQKHQVHIVHQNGRDTPVKGEAGQVGIDSVKISNDAQTAGWLVLYSDPDSSTPFAGTLVIWQGDKIVKRFEADQTFWSWAFYANDSEVAYHVGPTHGDAPHCELHDIDTGKLLASWNGDLEDAKRPAWTKGLDH
jgi:hypothetical protein